MKKEERKLVSFKLYLYLKAARAAIYAMKVENNGIEGGIQTGYNKPSNRSPGLCFLRRLELCRVSCMKLGN